MKLDVRLKKIRSCVVLKDANAEKLLRTDITVFSVVVVDLPTDYILIIVLFPAETDILVPVFSQSTEVVVVNFVVVLKFPDNSLSTRFSLVDLR